MPHTRLYIDGYNFYYAIKRDLPIYLGWCDFRKLGARFLLERDQTLGPIKYFTARVGYLGWQGEKGRQNAWLRAVQTIDDLEIVLGFYTKDKRHVRSRVEKQTDVNIAVHMLLDAMTDADCDRMILISEDIDLAPVVTAISTTIRSPKKVDVWFPSGEIGYRWRELELEEVRCRPISSKVLEKSRLPEEIHRDGEIIRCLRQWRKPR